MCWSMPPFHQRGSELAAAPMPPPRVIRANLTFSFRCSKRADAPGGVDVALNGVIASATRSIQSRVAAQRSRNSAKDDPYRRSESIPSPLLVRMMPSPFTVHGSGETRPGPQLGRRINAKFNRDDSIAGPDRHFGGNCADGWFAKSIRTTSIDDPGQANAAGGTGRPPPTAGRSSALGERPDG
jgi:hypothetical protein